MKDINDTLKLGIFRVSHRGISRVKGNQVKAVQYSGEVMVGNSHHLDVEEAREEQCGRTGWQLMENTALWEPKPSRGTQSTQSHLQEKWAEQTLHFHNLPPPIVFHGPKPAESQRARDPLV